MTHDVKVPFCMPEFFRRKIIEHQLHVKNGKGKYGIWYKIIIVHYLMVQLGLPSDFKCQVFQWDDKKVPMK